MMRSESAKTAVALAALLLSVLGLTWKGSAQISRLDSNVTGLSQFRTEQVVRNRDQDGRNEVTTQKLTRVETMMEMVVKGMGMLPPPKR